MKEEPTPPPAPATMAGQIEELLQARLSEMPEMGDRSIHIHQSPDGGVQIEVDGVYFDGVGDIADPEIRALIQSAIQAWESGSLPG